MMDEHHGWHASNVPLVSTALEYMKGFTLQIYEGWFRLPGLHRLPSAPQDSQGILFAYE